MSHQIKSKIKLLSYLISSLSFVSLYTFSNSEVDETSDDDQMEEVLVVGIKGAISRAIDIKRDAASIVEAISAEDIGKLPDTTIADSLQRITGVQIRRSAGEGSSVNLRGTPQVSTLLNGEQFVSAGAITRTQPDFSDIPSELVSGIDVVKSQTASTLAGGISGTIDLKTRRPLSLEEGLTFSGSVETATGSYSQNGDGKVSGFIGLNDNHKRGIVISATYSDVTLADYRLGSVTDGWWMAFNESGHDWVNAPKVELGDTEEYEDINQDGDVNDAYFGFIDYGAMNKFSERERYGLSSSFEAVIGHALKFTADIFYTKMEQADSTQGLVADNAWSDYGWVKPAGGSAINRGPFTLEKSKQVNELWTSRVQDLSAERVKAFTSTWVNDRDSTNINVELSYDNGGMVTGNVRYLHGEAEQHVLNNFADAFLTSGEQYGLWANYNGTPEVVNPNGYGPDEIELRFDFTGRHPKLVFPDVAVEKPVLNSDGDIVTTQTEMEQFGSNVGRYDLVSTFSENNYDEKASLDVFRFDGRLALDTGPLKSTQFGYRYGNRKVSRDSWVMLAPFTAGGITELVMWKDASGTIGDTNEDGKKSVEGGDLSIGAPRQMFTDLQERGWIHEVSDFGPAGNNESYYFIKPEVMKDAWAFQNALYPGNIKAFQPEHSYDIRESTHTLYLQTDFEWSLGRIGINGNLGSQVIRTELEVIQNEKGDEICILCKAHEDLGDIITRRDFTDFLPSANMSFWFSNALVLRLAAAKTMTRLDLDRLGKGLSIDRNRAGEELGELLGVDPDFMIAMGGSVDGNPYLDPWRSTNKDITLEWYFQESGLINLGIFQMDIESFPTSGSFTMGLPDEDGITRRAFAVDVTVNGEGGKFEGFEFAYQQAYEFLPGVLSDLGSQINYTYVSSDSGDTGYYGERLPMESNSRESANVVLWYEKYGVQARIAYNYRSKRLNWNEWIDGLDANLPFWTKPTHYVDLSLSYDLNDNLSIYSYISNLTEEYEDRYVQWEDNPVNQNIYERRYTLGLRAKF